jgi:tellurite resistance protein
MRYRGGFCGGVLPTSLRSDLGNGKFDGAHLVSNFESLNPANTLWTKQYNVYANVDTEEKRYLDFEKWRGGFFKMNLEEIHFIKGGFQEAVVRIILAVAMVNQSYDRQEYAVARRIIQTNDRFKQLAPVALKRLFKEQAGIIAYNQEEAIRTLTTPLPRKADRIEAFEIANSIATADMELDLKEQELLAEIKRTLNL